MSDISGASSERNFAAAYAGRAERVPALPGHPFANVPRLRSDALELLREARFAPVVLLGRFPLRRFYVANEPELIEEILLNRSGAWEMTRDSDVLRAIFGSSMLLLKGDEYLQRRQVILPAFRAAHLADLTANMAGPVRRTLPSIEETAARGGTVDLEQLAITLVQRVTVKVMFGPDFDEDIGALSEIFTTGMVYRQRRRWGLIRVPLFVPTPANRRFHAIVRELRRVVSGIVASASKSGGATNLLALLLATELNESQIVDEVMGIFNAGFVSTSTAVAWTLYVLASNPEVERMVRDEVTAVVRGDVPTLEEAKRMRVTTSVALETMRLHPPAWLLTRRAVRDARLGPYRIPAGSTMLLSPYSTQRNPAYWPDPDRFDPQRFADPHAAAHRPKFAFFGFGGGVRGCIGREIGIVEMMVIIGALLQRFRFAMVPGHPVASWPLTVLKPRHGLVANVHRA